jgi:mono/diheme cytochrome c family protein
MNQFMPLALVFLVLGGPHVVARSAELGAAYQQFCAACHLSDGSGVPGAYPRLAGRVASMAADAAGREYLVQVLTKGLMGPIVVDGTRLQGVMPPQAALSDEQTAQVLNDLIGSGTVGPKVFEPAEVSAIRAKHKDVSMNGVIGMRPSGAVADKP